MIKICFIPALLLLLCACKTPNKLAKQLQPANAPAAASPTFNTGDTIEINFAYTLHSTSSIFPAMPTKFSGLKVGDHFTANAFQHMQLDNASGLTVYDYVVVGKR